MTVVDHSKESGLNAYSYKKPSDIQIGSKNMATRTLQSNQDLSEMGIPDNNQRSHNASALNRTEKEKADTLQKS